MYTYIMDNIAETPTVLMFFSRSTDSLPGLGIDESIHNCNRSKYEELAKIPHWRRVLSNFYTRDGDAHLFVLDGLHWRSVEHYFQAAKFVSINPQYYASFALESGSPLSRADGPVAKKAGREIKLTPNEVADWDARKDVALARAREAKFTQNQDCKRILILTDGALLTHRASVRSPICYETALMDLRKKLLSA